MMQIGSRRVHLVGVGGSGMSALARMLHGVGGEVTGSDAHASKAVEQLRREGIRVWSGHHPELVEGETGYVIRSAAVPPSDPEFEAAERRGFTPLLYAQAVGRLTEGKRSLCIAGTHGKTTTTGLTVSALRGAKLDPSHLIGGDCPELGGNGHGGEDPLFVVEACEFNRSFHALRPHGAVILNLDHDHFECYPEEQDLLDAFAHYLAQVREGGVVLVEEQVPACVLEGVPEGVRVLRVGTGLFADIRPLEIDDDLGRYSFVPMLEGRRLPRVQLQLHGRFQVTNALFALGLSVLGSGADPEGACEGLGRFRGVQRRFEVRKGARGGVVINDYAHHPAELRAVIRAARKRFPGRRLLAAFQPHQHRRTLELLAEFADVLAAADESIVAEIYGARESDELKRAVSAESLVDEIRARGGGATPGGPVSDLAQVVGSLRRDDDVVLLLGAGDIDRALEEIVAAV